MLMVGTTYEELQNREANSGATGARSDPIAKIILTAYPKCNLQIDLNSSVHMAVGSQRVEI